METENNWHIDPETLLQIPGKVWVFWKNHEGVYAGCNDLMAKTLHLNSRHEIFGRTDYDFPLSKSEVKLYREADRHVILQNRALQFKESASFADVKITFQTLKMPLLNHKNKVTGVLGMSYYVDVKQLDVPLLTSRENQILSLLKNGKTAKEIAAILSRSPRTIEHHIERIKDKKGVRSKYELFFNF